MEARIQKNLGIVSSMTIEYITTALITDPNTVFSQFTGTQIGIKQNSRFFKWIISKNVHIWMLG